MRRILLFCSVSLLFVSALSFNHVALAARDPLAVSVNETLKIEIIKLTDKVYQHISYQEVAPYGLVAASGLVVIDGKDAHIIDTPWSSEDTADLMAWIEGQGLTVKSAVVSHFHQDASSASTAELVPGLIEAFYPGPGHSQGNLVVWLPQYPQIKLVVPGHGAIGDTRLLQHT
jgi:hypothetical protein